MVHGELFEGCRWPNDHHVAAGRSAIFDPVKARRSADGGTEDVSRQVRMGGDRKVGDQAVGSIASIVIPPSLSPVVPLLTFAQSSGPARELPRHSGGFDVRGTCAPSMIWHSLTGPKRRLPTQTIGLDDKELAVESSPGPPSEWQRRYLPGHGRAARRPASRLWYTKPASRQIWSPPAAIACLPRGCRREGRYGSGAAFRGFRMAERPSCRCERSAIFDPWKPSGALPEAVQISRGRCVLVGTARVAATAIETIAWTVICLSRIAGLCSGSLNHEGR